MPQRNATPRAAASRASSCVNCCASPDSSLGGVDAADEPVAARRERRLDRDAFVDRLHVAVAAVFAHQLRRRDAVVELLGVGVELQDAALEVVVLDARRRAQRAQASRE